MLIILSTHLLYISNNKQLAREYVKVTFAFKFGFDLS